MRATRAIDCWIIFLVSSSYFILGYPGWKVRLPENRIIGGSLAIPGQFPYQVALIIPVNDSYTQICGGSIISADWILTAAHCVHR